MLFLKAPAKLNLALEILGKRPDGYHEVRSVMQTVDLYDRLRLEPADDLRFSCSVEALQSSDNLVVRAARLLVETAGIKCGANIILDKAIPWGSGLGGGSSDAAACLVGLNRMWGLGMSLDRLRLIAGRLGSDVPFFLYGGTCLVEGRGEEVVPLPASSSFWAVILVVSGLKGMKDKTKRMYQSLTDEDITDGGKVERLYRSLVKGERLNADVLFNAFERVAPRVFPGLSEYWRRFEAVARQKVHLCGSGPALFSLHETRQEAEEIAVKLSARDVEVFVVGQTESS